MPERLRLSIFAVGVVVLFGLYVAASAHLPAWGSFHGSYGEYVAHMAVYERHATDTINVVNYDYRGFDTLGEEFILFTAVVGVMLLLRRDTPPKPGEDGSIADRAPLSPTIRALALPAAGVCVVFGLYVGLHGQLTPGGGFQGGVILATAPMLIYLAENTKAFTRITSHRVVEAIEAMGAGGYALLGCLPLFVDKRFLTNVLPLGTTGNTFSAGMISAISDTVGVEVTAAFLLVTYTYLQEIILGGIPEE